MPTNLTAFLLLICAVLPGALFLFKLCIYFSQRLVYNEKHLGAQPVLRPARLVGRLFVFEEELIELFLRDNLDLSVVDFTEVSIRGVAIRHFTHLLSKSLQVEAAGSFFLSSSFPLDICNFIVFSRFRMPTNCSAFLLHF